MGSFAAASSQSLSPIFLDSGAHFACSRVYEATRKKNKRSFDSESLKCCSSGPNQQQVTDALNDDLQQQYDVGMWMWGKNRLDTIAGDAPCLQKRDAAIHTLFPSVATLKARLSSLSVPAATDDHNQTTTDKRVKELKELLRVVQASSDPDLTLQVRIRLAEEEFVREFLKGVAVVQKEAASRVPTICQLIQHRKIQTEGLEVIFDRAAKIESRDGSGNAWLSRHLADTARAIRRPGDPHGTQTGNYDHDRINKWNESVAMAIHNTVNELLGEDISNEEKCEPLVLYAAYKGSGCRFSDARQVLSGDFHGRITRRLQDFNFSILPDNARIIFPLPIVCWALRKSFSAVCRQLGLNNLKRLKHLARAMIQAFDALDEAWTRKTAAPDWATKTEGAKDKEQEDLQLEAARIMTISLGELRKPQPVNTGLEGQGRRSADNTGREPNGGSDDERDPDPAPSRPNIDLSLHHLADVALDQQPQASLCNSYPNPSADSAYATDPSAMDNARGDTSHMPRPPNPSSRTASPMVPGNQSGGDSEYLEPGSGELPARSAAGTSSWVPQAFETAFGCSQTPGFGRAIDAQAGQPPAKRQKTVPPQMWPIISDDRTNDDFWAMNTGSNDEAPQPVASGSNYDPIRNIHATRTNMPFNDVQSPFMPNSGVFTVVEPLQQSGSCGFDFTDINFDALLQQASNLGAEGFSYDPFIT